MATDDGQPPLPSVRTGETATTPSSCPLSTASKATQSPDTATRACEELKRNAYDGGYTILRERIKHLRKTPLKPLTIRFETAPGVQAQMDWATYTLDFTSEGRRRVNLFSFILGYHKSDLLRAMQRGVQYHAFGFSSLQRILAHQATPKPNWQQLDETSQDTIRQLSGSEPVGPRHSQEYQNLLYGNSSVTDETHETNEQPKSSAIDPPTSSDTEDSAQ